MKRYLQTQERKTFTFLLITMFFVLIISLPAKNSETMDHDLTLEENIFSESANSDPCNVKLGETDYPHEGDEFFTFNSSTASIDCEKKQHNLLSQMDFNEEVGSEESKM